MLPSFLQSSYKQYKTDSDFVATWLAQSAQRCGYSRDLLVPTTTIQAPKPPKLRGRARKLARDAAAAAAKQGGSSNTTKDGNIPPTETAILKASKYLISIKDFIVLAEWIVKAKDPVIRIPMSFVKILNRSIATRKRHHEWWSRTGDGSHANPSLKKTANEKHLFFIDVLEQVRKILQPKIFTDLLPDNAATVSGGQVNVSQGSLPTMFSSLNVEHPSDPDPDEAPTSSSARPNSIPSTQPQEEYTVDQEQDIEEVYFAVQCLFNDLDNIRRYLGKVWEGYKTGAFDLVAASIVTNTAIEFSRRLQEDFIETFPQHTDWGEHIKVLYLQQCLAYDQTPSDKERPDDEMNFHVYAHVEPLLFPAYLILSAFTRMIKPGQLPMYRPGFFGRYGPSSDRNSKSARDKFREDKIVLFEALPEFCVLTRYRGDVPAEDELTRGIRDLAETKKIQVWLVFAAQIFLDIHHIVRDSIAVGFNDLIKSSQYVANNINRALEFHENLRVEHWPPENDKVLGRILGLITDWVQKDKVADTKIGLLKRSPNQPFPAKAFVLLKQHPWYCGLLSYSIKALALDAAITFANAWGSILYCAHLYNAVRQEKLLTDVWPDMNLALFMHDFKRMFIGNFPHTCEDYFKRFCLAMGYSATNFAKDKRPGQPAASRSGPRGLGDLAPVCNKFKERFCYGEERSDLLPADIEAMLEEHDDTISDIDLGEEYSDWVIPTIEINEPNVPALDAQEGPGNTEGQARHSDAPISVASGVKPVRILNALLQAVQSEMLELTFDHFCLHTFCWRLLRSVQKAIDSELKEIYGANYLEKENQLPFVVGYILMTATQTTKLAGVLLPKKSEVVTSRLLATAAQSIKTMIDEGAAAIEISMLQRQFGIDIDMDDMLGGIVEPR